MNSKLNIKNDPAPSTERAAWIATACTALLLTCGNAGAAEIRAALGGWHYDLSGSVVDGSLVYDFEDDLGIGSQGEYHMEFEWQTSPGWWPDVVLSWSKSEAGGRRFFPGTPPLVEDRTIVTKAKNGDLDLVLRYPFMVGPVRFASGLTLKQVTSDIRIDDSAQSEPTNERVNVVLPQAHLSLQWPLTELLGLTATLQGVKFGDNQAYDARAGVEFSLFDPVLVEAGWQQKRYEVNAGDYALDATLRGFLLRIRARFPL